MSRQILSTAIRVIQLLAIAGPSLEFKPPVASKFPSVPSVKLTHRGGSLTLPQKFGLY